MNASDQVKFFWENRPTEAAQALHDVMAERHRQMMVEGWTAKHDDEHGAGSMAFAAAAYAVHAHAGPRLSSTLWNWTGWARDWWKPKDARRDLIRAAALLLAEIERIDRAAAPKWKPCARCTTPDFCTNSLRGCDISESAEAGIAPLAAPTSGVALPLKGGSDAA